MAAISVTLDGTAVSSAMTSFVSGEVETAVNLPGRFRLVFSDPSHSMVSDLAVKVGTDVTISSGTAVLIMGEVTAVEAEYDQQQGTQLIVRGYDKLHRLQGGRSAQVFADQSSFGDVVSALASAHGLATSDLSGAPTAPAPWIGQRDVSDWDLLVALAEEAGAVVGIDAQGQLNFSVPTNASSGPEPGSPSSGPPLSPLQLVPDNNLIRVRAIVSGAQQATQVTVRSWDVNQKQAVVGSHTAATTGVSATLSPTEASSALSGKTFVDGSTSVPDQGSATALAASLADRIGSTVGEIEGTAVLTAEMRAGVAVSLGNLGSPFDGKYVLSSVRHHFSARSGDRTFFAASGRQDRTVLGLTGGADGTLDRRANRFAGVINAIVTDIQDPSNLGRVKVKVPMWDDNFVSDWARVVQVGAGTNRGAFFPPHVNDEVLLAFENNDLRRPAVLGGLYNGKDTPALGGSDLVDNGTYIRRGIVSALGNMLVFFDGSSKEGMALVTSDKQYSMSINKTQKQIKITVTESGGKLVISTAGDISLTSTGGDVSITGNNVSFTANQALKLKSNSGASIEDATTVAIKGAQITLN